MCQKAHYRSIMEACSLPGVSGRYLFRDILTLGCLLRLLWSTKGFPSLLRLRDGGSFWNKHSQKLFHDVQRPQRSSDLY